MIRDRRPLASQVQDGIREIIVAKRMLPGDRLPSEGDLAVRFQVGRTTIREALRGLQEQGLIDVQRGKGRFVSAASALTVDRPITRFESVTEMMQGLGHDVVNRVLGVTEDRATLQEAQEFGFDSALPVVRLERLRLSGDDPLIYSVNVLPRSLFSEPPAAIDWSGSVVQLLADRGQRVVSSAARVSATRLPSAAAHHFPGCEYDPWLLIIETCVTDVGTPVLLARDYHRGDSFTFQFLRRREY